MIFDQQISVFSIGKILFRKIRSGKHNIVIEDKCLDVESPFCLFNLRRNNTLRAIQVVVLEISDCQIALVLYII